MSSLEFSIASEDLANMIAGSYEQLTAALEAHISASWGRIFGEESTFFGICAV